MRKNLYLALIISLLFSGCSQTVIQGVNPSEIDQMPVVMVAKSKITCGSIIVKEGTAFSIKEIGGVEYKIVSDYGLLGDTFNMFSGGNTYNFPDNALMLKWDESMDDTLEGGKGFIVYPNGKFAYETYFAASYNLFGGNWWLSQGICKFIGEYPFEIRK